MSMAHWEAICSMISGTGAGGYVTVYSIMSNVMFIYHMLSSIVYAK